MRVYIMYRGKRTTVSIEEQLIEYLADRICKSASSRAFSAKKQVRGWIHQTIDRAGAGAPTHNVSQWVRAQIIDAIVDPTLIQRRQEAAVKKAQADENMRALFASLKPR